jgi:hypothetical protein
MKYHEAINGPNREAWKAEVKKEHQGMISNGLLSQLRSAIFQREQS